MKKELDFVCYYSFPREKDFLSDSTLRERRAREAIVRGVLESVLGQNPVEAIFELSEGLENTYHISKYLVSPIAAGVWRLRVDSDSINMIWPMIFDSLKWPHRRVIAFSSIRANADLERFLAVWHQPSRLKNPRVPLGRMLGIVTSRIEPDQCAIVFDRISISQFMLVSPVRREPHKPTKAR